MWQTAKNPVNSSQGRCRLCVVWLAGCDGFVLNPSQTHHTHHIFYFVVLILNISHGCHRLRWHYGKLCRLLQSLL